jgi:hypothetical protein
MKIDSEPGVDHQGSNEAEWLKVARQDKNNMVSTIQ